MPELPKLPSRLAETREAFLELGVKDRLLLLLEFANTLPDLPDRYSEHPDLLEQVVECQSPVFIITELIDGKVYMHASAPREAPTTRGFASIIANGVAGLTASEVLAIPDDYPQTLGLAEAVSPLRVRGMSALLGRTKRQVQSYSANG